MLSAIVFALIVSEVALRVAGFTYLNPYTVDPELGFTLRPNAEGWWTKEGSAYIKINSRGFRDYEHTLAKPTHTMRIAVLGDSFAEALQVPIENTFWSVMQRPLAGAMAQRGKSVEVLNFGVSGFSTARELILLRQRVWQYNPDVVVLLVTPGNDIKDNSAALSAYSKALPYFVSRNGSIVLDDSLLKAHNEQYLYKLRQSFPGKALDWIRDRSRVVGLLYTVREALGSRSKQSARGNTFDDERGIDANVFRSPVNPDWADAWFVTEKLLVQMRDEVLAKGARFLVVTATNGIQVDPVPTERTQFMKNLKVTTLFYPELRIKQLGEREKIDVLNLAPPLLEYATRDQVFLHGFGNSKGKGHWNEAGHRIAGQLIADRLRERL